ncbi:MAG: hypothetical protein EBV15_03550 [Bacteroidetes bacterium]|nr:hypothetical protein [Bacteroidota bacterium]
MSMRWVFILIVLLGSCKDDRAYYRKYPVKNAHYFDFKSDSLVFLVQGSFRSDREVWKRNPSIITVGAYYVYKRYRDFSFMDSIRIGFGENVIERIEYQKKMPLRVFDLTLMTETGNRYILANGSTAAETRGFYSQKQRCPWPFFTGKYIQANHEVNLTINDSISVRKITKEWFARDSGLIYFERITDSLKYGSLYNRREEKGRRTNF